MILRPRHILLPALVALLAGPPADVSAWGEQKVAMKAVGPDCGLEVIYRWTSAFSGKGERYSVHAEKLTVSGIPSYQSISVYPDRVRRITIRQSDLTPLCMIEKWNEGPGVIQRIYSGKQVRVIRRGVPEPIDTVMAVPEGVHDPESFAFLLRGYPFHDQDTVAPIQVLLAEPNPILSIPRVLSVEIVPRGQARVTVPAGSFDCWVLEMTLAGALGYVVPNNRFFLLKQQPHLIVKAEGAGERVELVAGPFPCDGKKHCLVGAEVPRLGP